MVLNDKEETDKIRALFFISLILIAIVKEAQKPPRYNSAICRCVSVCT